MSDPIAVSIVAHGAYLIGSLPFGWNDGQMVTDEDIYECLAWCLDPLLPLFKQARDQVVGARREWYEMSKNINLIGAAVYSGCHGTQKNALKVRALTDPEWGEDGEKFMESVRCIKFQRHHAIGRGTPMGFSMIMHYPAAYIAEKRGNLQQFLEYFAVQRQYGEAYVGAITPFSADDNWEGHQWWIGGSLAGRETAHLHPFREKLLRLYKLAGFASAGQIQERYEQWPIYTGVVAGGMAVSDEGLVSAISCLCTCVVLTPPFFASTMCSIRTTW